ncbi:hypothetical protein PQZ11_00995 [Luminiphilus sp.]|nr:hypothetical protein [Luminiphilus sp.]
MLKAWSLTSTSATGINFNASSVATRENMYLVAYQNGKAFLYNDVEADGEATIQAAETTLIGFFEGVAAGALSRADLLI